MCEHRWLFSALPYCFPVEQLNRVPKLSNSVTVVAPHLGSWITTIPSLPSSVALGMLPSFGLLLWSGLKSLSSHLTDCLEIWCRHSVRPPAWFLITFMTHWLSIRLHHQVRFTVTQYFTLWPKSCEDNNIPISCTLFWLLISSCCHASLLCWELPAKH